MDPKNYEHLIDRELIRTATAEHAAAQDRLKQTAAGLEEATEEHRKAKVASDNAIAGHSDTDPIAAEHDLEAAARALSVARRMHEAAEQGCLKADEVLNAKRGVAWGPVYMAGVRRRLAAAKAGDEARAALDVANAEHLAGAEMQQAAFNNGCPHIGHQHNGPRLLRSEVEESALWTANGVAPDFVQHPWNPGV